MFGVDNCEHIVNNVIYIYNIYVYSRVFSEINKINFFVQSFNFKKIVETRDYNTAYS